jgi:hypothetical protein
VLGFALALVGATGVPSARPGSFTGGIRPPIVNARAHATAATAAIAATTIGARQAMGNAALVATAELSNGGTSPAEATPATAAMGAAPAATAPGTIPQPGQAPAARVQHRSHERRPHDGQMDSPIFDRVAAGPIRLPQRSQKGRDGLPSGAATGTELVESASGRAPPSPSGHPDAGGAFTMNVSFREVRRLDLVLRASAVSCSPPAYGILHATTIHRSRVGWAPFAHLQNGLREPVNRSGAALQGGPARCSSATAVGATQSDLQCNQEPDGRQHEQDQLSCLAVIHDLCLPITTRHSAAPSRGR